MSRSSRNSSSSSIRYSLPHEMSSSFSSTTSTTNKRTLVLPANVAPIQKQQKNNETLDAMGSTMNSIGLLDESQNCDDNEENLSDDDSIENYFLNQSK